MLTFSFERFFSISHLDYSEIFLKNSNPIKKCPVYQTQGIACLCWSLITYLLITKLTLMVSTALLMLS